MTVEWEEGFSIRVDFEKDKKISRQAEFFRLTAVLCFRLCFNQVSVCVGCTVNKDHYIVKSAVNKRLNGRGDGLAGLDLGSFLTITGFKCLCHRRC